MSKDTNNKKTSSQIAPQEDKFSYINNLVNNSNKILNNKAISEESKKYSSLFENSLIANQLGKTQELLPGDVRNITGGADYEKVQDILGQGYNIFDGSLNVRKALGDKQSGWAQAGGALNQAIVGEIVGGTIEGTGRLLDIKGSIDLYNGNIKEFDNVLTELGSGLKGWAEHSTPIFGSDEMFSSGWWAKGLVTTASSLSLLIPAMGTVRAVGGLGRALGVLKSMETLSKAGRTAAWIRTGVSQAVVSRHMENWLEAREVWDNTLNEYVNNKGLSLQEAEQAASKAVRQSYILNTAMLTQDLFQYLLIGRKTFGSSEASDKIMSALGKSKSSILGSRAKSLGMNMASEGFEEAYQYVVGNEVVNYQMYKDGLASNPVSDKFLSGYMKDNEFWTSVIFGALGAGVHSGVGKMFNKAFYSKKLETNDNLRIENFKKTQEIQKRIYNKLAKAYESNNQEAVESAIEELTYLSALNSYEFGNSDIALETMGMIKDASNEELVAMGLPEDKIDEFKANIDNAINQTKDIFKKLKKNSKIFGDEINKEVTTTELQLEKIDRLINNSEKSITEKRKELEKSIDLKNLSTEEQQILENKLFIDGGKSRINAIDEFLQKNNQLTEEQKINFETQKAEIEQLVKEKSKDNKKLIQDLSGSSYLGNVFSDKGLSSISTLFDEEFNSISASVNDNNVSSREEYLSSLDKSKREKLESLEKRLDKISKANELYTAELQKELAKHGVFKLRQKELQKNLDYYTSKKYIKEKKQIIEEVRKKQTEAAQQAINDEKVADDTINSKANQNKKTNEAETTTVPGFNEVVENLNNKVKQKTEEQGYNAEIVDFVNNYFNASKNNKVNKQIKKLLDKNKIYNFFSTLNENSELSDLEQAIYDYFSNPTEVNFNKIKTLAKEDNSYNKESDVFKAEEAIKEIENQAEEEVKAEIVAAKKVVALNQSNEIPETTNNSVETNVLDENEDVFESDIREYKEYDEESSGAVSVEPTSLAWRSSSAMDNLEEDNDVELTKFLENPSIDITEFNAEFEIDEDYLKQNKTLYDKLNSGETLTQEDINNIPIKVYFLNKEGNRVKNKNNEDLFSYLHANDFWNGKNIQSVNPEDLKKELAIFKFNILKKLQNNEKAISKILNQKDGILQEDYEMVLNPATNVKERKLIFKPLSEAIALDENELEFLFGDSFNQYILGNTIDQESLQHTTATPGALYIKFKKPNGKVFPARVFVRRLDNNDVNALFSILNYAYVQNQTLKTEISKLSTELQKELKSSQFVKDLIDVLGSKATLLDVLNNFVYEGKLSQGKGLNELRKVGNDVFINGKKYNVVDFTTDKQNEIKAELAKKMINISAKKLNQASYKKILIDNNVVQTHIRLKKGYVTPFSTPTTVISNRLEGDSTNQSSDVEERFDDETTKQFTQEADIEKKLQELKNYFNDNTRSTADSRYNPDISGEGELALREQEEQLLQLRADIIQAHGLTKGSIGQQFKDLLDILTKGLDNRGGGQLYTAPLVMPDDFRAGAGSALGTGGGTAYIDGAFIILAKKGINEIKSVNDIGGILVNQAVSDSLPELVSKLKQLFPNLSIESYSNSVNAISEINAKYDAELAELNKSTQSSNKADEIKAEIERVSKLLFAERILELKKLGVIKEVYQYGNRPIVVVNINGELLPFYRSSTGTSGKEKGKWFPMFGFGKSKPTDTEIGWLIKPSIKDLENNLNSKAIEEYSNIINSTLNWEHSLDTQSLNNPFFKPFVTLKTDEKGFNEKIFGQKDLGVSNDGKTSYQHIDSIVNKINAKYDAELNKLTQPSNKANEIKSDIERLEKEKREEENNPLRVNLAISLVNAKNDAKDNPESLLKGLTDSEIEDIFKEELANINLLITKLKEKGKSNEEIAKVISSRLANSKVLKFKRGFNNTIAKDLENFPDGGYKTSEELNAKYNAQIAQKQAELAELEKRKPEIVNRYSDSDVKSNPDKIYVFGDNVQRTGTGGQAQIRNNSNAFGIATKLKPSNNQDAFMSDNDLEYNKKIIDSDIQKILNQNKPLVFPKDGFGTGLAKLKEKAPKTYEYLRQRLLEEFYFDNENGKIIENNEKLAALESKQEVVKNENVIDKDIEDEKSKLSNTDDVDINDFDPESAFSTKQTPQKTDNDKLNEAVEVLNKILPKEVAITLQDDLIKIFENGDAAVASFSKAGIILSSFADDTDAYHEAFHAVFRLLLSGKERNNLIENSKNDFLEPTDEQIKILMDRHNLSKEEATDLYYEEILADEFGKYMSNPNEYTFNNKEQKSFFEKLLSWINNILGIKSNREKVFSSIRKGDYSNSKQAKDSLANLDVNSTELAMFNNEVNYMLKSVEILQSDKAKQVFAKAEKNNWDLNKTLTELQIPKEQKQLILDLGINNREEIALELASKYSYTVEVNTAKSKEDFSDSDTQEIVFTTQSGIRYYGDYQENYFSKNKETISKEEFVTALNNNRSINNSSYYANLTVPGGTNYTENEISTPAITPSIKGHAQFATDKGIGWFRSDEQGKSFVADNQYEADIYEELGYTKINGTSKPTYIEKSKTRRILEVQSDLFQKGRDKESLIPNKYSELKISLTYDRELHYVNNKWILIRKPNSEEKQKLPPIDRYNNNYRIKEILSDEKGILLFNDYKKSNENSSQYEKSDSQNKKNQFLQLLNKNNNWVTFFVKSIVQDSAKKGYEKVLFPTGNTASKIEGHDTLEEFKREKEDRIKELENKKSKVDENTNPLDFLDMNEAVEIAGPDMSKDIPLNIVTEKIDREINQLKQELERVDKEGFGALRPIYNFYENTVTNILKKQGYNAELITDEYGNTWNEVTIKQSRDLSPIVFKTKNRIVESKSEQLSYSNYFEARMNKPGNPLSEQQFNSLSLTEQEVLINQTKYC